jgi:hypothetical protein
MARLVRLLVLLTAVVVGACESGSPVGLVEERAIETADDVCNPEMQPC